MDENISLKEVVPPSSIHSSSNNEIDVLRSKKEGSISSKKSHESVGAVKEASVSRKSSVADFHKFVMRRRSLASLSSSHEGVDAVAAQEPTSSDSALVTRRAESNFSQDNIYNKLRVQTEKKLIAKFHERQWGRSFWGGGINGPRAIVRAFSESAGRQDIIHQVKEGMAQQKVKGKTKNEIWAEIRSLKKLAEHTQFIQEKQGDVVRDLFNDQEINRNLLGKSFLQHEGLFKKMTDDINSIADRIPLENTSVEKTPEQKHDNSEILLENLSTLREHGERCMRVAYVNFSDFTQMTKTTHGNALELFSYFHKYRMNTLHLDKHNRRIRRGMDILTGKETAINNMLTNLPWSEISTSSRVADIKSEVGKHPAHIPEVVSLENRLQRNRSEERLEEPSLQREKGPLQQLYAYVSSDNVSVRPEVLQQHPKAARDIKVYLERKMKKPITTSQEEDMQFIDHNIKTYANGLIRSVLQECSDERTDFGKLMKAHVENYKNAYAAVEKDLAVSMDYYRNVNTEKGNWSSLNAVRLKVFNNNIERLEKSSADLREKIADEARTRQKEFRQAFDETQRNLMHGNMDSYNKALGSFGNVTQKILTSVLFGALGHSAAGFPNA